MRERRIKYIKYTVLVFNIIAVMSITLFVYLTTWRICSRYTASDFLETANALPGQPKAIVFTVGLLLVALIGSFLLREYIFESNPAYKYGSLVFDFVVSLMIVVLMDFNYNGILLWVFANVVSHIRDIKGQYLFMALAILSYIGTDHGLAAASHNLYSVEDYIGYYDAVTQQYLLGVYNVMLSVNIILFLVYCIYVILEQIGTIAEVKQLYQQLSEANGELQEANVKLQKYAVMKEKMGETKERNRLAREIHDTLGHTLTGISAGIDACLMMIDSSPKDTRKQLEMISNVARDGIKEVRRSVNELRPDALERLSLEHAITKMVDEMNTMTSTKVHFKCDIENLRFDEDEENTIYRIIQESMTNSVRHGQAQTIWISITRDFCDIHLTIKDDGTGCKEMKKGFGTRHIIERIKMLNGTVEFDGSDGFTTKVVIPIRWGEEYD